MYSSFDPETLKFVENYCRQNLACYGLSALYFFGSRAYGRTRSDSDHDFYAVVSDTSPSDINTGGALHTKIYDAFNLARTQAGLKGIDLLIVHQTVFQNQSGQVGTFANEAFTKGKKLI